MKNDYQDFLVSSESSPRPEVVQNILNKADEYIRPSLWLVSGKYLVLFSLAVLMSLSLCPQSGVSVIRSDFPLFHHFLHQHIILCGIYCAAVFFFTTHVSAFFLLTRFEKKVFSKNLIYLPLIPLSLFFSFFMLISPEDVSGHFWNKPYVLSWMMTAVFLFIVWKLSQEKIFAHNRSGGIALR